MSLFRKKCELKKNCRAGPGRDLARLGRAKVRENGEGQSRLGWAGLDRAGLGLVILRGPRRAGPAWGGPRPERTVRTQSRLGWAGLGWAWPDLFFSKCEQRHLMAHGHMAASVYLRF